MFSNHIIQALVQGATVITPNNRLSEQLFRQFLQAKQQKTHAKPACFAYPSFLRESFKALTQETPNEKHPRLLTDAHLQALWRKLLAPEESLDTHQNLLNAIHQAFVVCENWNITFPNPEFQLTPQTMQFERLRLKLSDALKKLHAITESELGRYLTTHLKTPKTERILWVCFDDYTPRQLELQAHFTKLGITQEHIELEGTEAQSYQCIAHDKNDEYARLVSFIKAALQNKTKRIGIIVPNLNQEAPQLNRYLKRHLEDKLFSFSLGKPLADYPLIAHALQWLKLGLFEIGHHEAKLLLNSPYLKGAQEEFYQRANALQTTPLLQERVIPLKNLKYALAQKTPLLVEALTNLTPYPKEAGPRVWAKLFINRLNELGFPGEQSLNSVQYQCFERFTGLFDEFITLSVIHPSMTVKVALEAFQDLAKRCIFQPEKADTPVSILGLLEASGSAFDAIWMCSATHQNLPSKSHLNAFIPVSLQREANMPHAHMKREHMLAEKRIERFKNACQTLVFSYPALLNDIPALPSPLIADLPEYTHATTAKAHKTALLHSEESYQLPLTDFDSKTGGSARLADQALCPFRAFAAHRLYATEIPDSTDGLDASLRGQIIHQILEELWRLLGSQKALLATTTEALDTKIEKAIQKALSPLKGNKPHSFPKLMQTVESKRLKRLVHAALSWDKARAPFKIDALEKQFQLHLGELEFQVRLDRLDALASGEKWLIDYKSRIPSPLPFDEERPEAPQLLLYALLDTSIKGLLFIELKKGQVACRGFAKEDHGTQGVKTLKEAETWLEYQQYWHKRLTALADEFYRGYNPPMPKKSSTCQTCRFHSLCRI